MSDRTVARLSERRAVTASLNRCELAWLGGCSGPVDGHEVVRRSKNREAQYDPLLVIGLCRSHHERDAFRLEAERLGIRVPGWLWDRDGYKAVEWARRIRESRGDLYPYWWKPSGG